MKPKLILLLILLPLVIFADEPQPWWMRVDETQSLLMKWITLLTVVATALVGGIFAVYALIKSKINEVRERLDRQSQKITSQQEQITQVAMATDPKQRGLSI